MPNDTGKWLPVRTATSVALEERESASTLRKHATVGSICLAPVLTCTLASVATV